MFQFLKIIFASLLLFNCSSIFGHSTVSAENTLLDSVKLYNKQIICHTNKYGCSTWSIDLQSVNLQSFVFQFAKGDIDKYDFRMVFSNENLVDSFHLEGDFLANSIQIEQDEHVESDVLDQSNLIFLDHQKRYVHIASKALIDKHTTITFIGLYVPHLDKITGSAITKRSNCELPAVIPQSVWRAGLPLPIPGRVSTPTHHCIVHHSAGGNGNTNYTDLVRSYYVLHTQVNGWDDIGYNYLIAANGDIYAGRDPEKAGILQDNVAGAHFCGKNQFTMGVCLIGDFSLQAPDIRAFSSLQGLIGWKIQKDNLDPFSKNLHPDASGQWLSVIAGHRDGCSTECPGDKLYSMLPQLRDDVKNCANDKKKWFVFSQQKQLFVKQLPEQSVVKLYDLNGKLLQTLFTATGTDQEMGIYSQGLYLVQVFSGTNTPEIQKVFIH